jgi:ferredoxin
MSSETSLSPAQSDGSIRFMIEAERCIGCTACTRLFPTLFRMDGDTARAADAAGTAGTAPAPPSRVVQACPTAAIRAEGALPAARLEQLAEVQGWEAEWARHGDEPEDPAERDRRYGRRLHWERFGDCHAVRIELPRTLPNQLWLYMYGIRRTAPEYHLELVQVGPSIVSVRGRLIDPRLQWLAGKLNSFPNGLKVDLQFPVPVGAAFFRLEQNDVWVYAFPAAVADPQAQLAALLRRHDTAAR